MSQSGSKTGSYYGRQADSSLKVLRKMPLVSTKLELMVPKPLLTGLQQYIDNGAEIWQEKPDTYENSSIDINRSALLRYLVSAKGFQSPDGTIPAMARKIHDSMIKAREISNTVRFTTKSAAFLRYSHDEVIEHLIQGMITEQIAIPCYFDGMQLIDRCNYSDLEWTMFIESKMNRMELNKLDHGIQP